MCRKLCLLQWIIILDFDNPLKEPHLVALGHIYPLLWFYFEVFRKFWLYQGKEGCPKTCSKSSSLIHSLTFIFSNTVCDRTCFCTEDCEGIVHCPNGVVPCSGGCHCEERSMGSHPDGYCVLPSHGCACYEHGEIKQVRVNV